MNHNQAPAPLEGVSPFTTPGTRRAWATGAEWVRHAIALEAGRCSAKRYADLAAHLDELARRQDFLAAQPLEELQAIRAVVTGKSYLPPRGRRAGTSYERVLNEVNNAITRERQHEQDEAQIAD